MDGNGNITYRKKSSKYVSLIISNVMKMLLVPFSCQHLSEFINYRTMLIRFLKNLQRIWKRRENVVLK